MEGGPFQIPDADVSHIRRKWLDLPYAGISPAQKLDIYLPAEGDGPFPVVLHIHGGGFDIGDKRDIHLMPFLQGLERGYAVVSVNYRLSGEAIFPAGLQDIKAAIRWLRANGEQYHLDGNRIAAWGGSAGGYYAAMICLTANVARAGGSEPGQSRDVRAMSRPPWTGLGRPIFSRWTNSLPRAAWAPVITAKPIRPNRGIWEPRITEIPEKVRRANPITYVHADMPPILIQHGRMDAMVPVQQSMSLGQQAGRIGRP